MKFAFGRFITGKRKPGLTEVGGLALANSKLPLVTDWAVAESNELWAVTSAELTRLRPEVLHESFPLPKAVAQPELGPRHRPTYVVGGGGVRDENDQAQHWRDALQAIPAE